MELPDLRDVLESPSVFRGKVTRMLGYTANIGAIGLAKDSAGDAHILGPVKQRRGSPSFNLLLDSVVAMQQADRKKHHPQSALQLLIASRLLPCNQKLAAYQPDPVQLKHFADSGIARQGCIGGSIALVDRTAACLTLFRARPNTTDPAMRTLKRLPDDAPANEIELHMTKAGLFTARLILMYPSFTPFDESDNLDRLYG